MALATLSAYAAVIYACERRFTQIHFVFAPGGNGNDESSSSVDGDQMTATILAHPVCAGEL